MIVPPFSRTMRLSGLTSFFLCLKFLFSPVGLSIIYTDWIVSHAWGECRGFPKIFNSSMPLNGLELRHSRVLSPEEMEALNSWHSRVGWIGLGFRRLTSLESCARGFVYRIPSLLISQGTRYFRFLAPRNGSAQLVKLLNKVEQA